MEPLDPCCSEVLGSMMDRVCFEEKGGLLALPRELWGGILALLGEDPSSLAAFEGANRRARCLALQEGWAAIRRLRLTLYAIRDQALAVRLAGRLFELWDRDERGRLRAKDEARDRLQGLLVKVLDLAAVEEMELRTVQSRGATDSWLRGKPKACGLSRHLLRDVRLAFAKEESRHRLKTFAFYNGQPLYGAFSHLGRDVADIFRLSADTLTSVTLRPLETKLRNPLRNQLSTLGGCPELGSLSVALSGSDWFDAAALGTLAGGPKLAELRIAGCDRINAPRLLPSEMAAVLHALPPKLRLLSLRGSAQHRDDFLLHYSRLVEEDAGTSSSESSGHGLSGVAELRDFPLESRRNLDQIFTSFPSLRLVEADYAAAGSEGTDRSWNVHASASLAAHFLSAYSRASPPRRMELRVLCASPVERFEALAEEFASTLRRASAATTLTPLSTTSIVLDTREGKRARVVCGVRWEFVLRRARLLLDASTVCNASNGFRTLHPSQ